MSLHLNGGIDNTEEQVVKEEGRCDLQHASKLKQYDTVIFFPL